MLDRRETLSLIRPQAAKRCLPFVLGPHRLKVISPLAQQVRVTAEAAVKVHEEGLEVRNRGRDEGPTEFDLLPHEHGDDCETGVVGLDVLANVVEVDCCEASSAGWVRVS